MLRNKLVLLITALLAVPSGFVAAAPQTAKEVHSKNPIVVNQAAIELRNKLAAIPLFSAKFDQQVFDLKNQLIQQASGSVKVSQPNQFSWLTNEPDESLIVSDGKSVWVYNPFVEQVSILSLDQTVKQSPLWLIANQTDEAWDQFKVTSNGATYSITPDDPQSLTRQIDMSFQRGELVSLKLVDSQGQSSLFTLTDFNRQPDLATDTFTFVPPEGVDIDDQRNIR